MTDPRIPEVVKVIQDHFGSADMMGGDDELAEKILAWVDARRCGSPALYIVLGPEEDPLPCERDLGHEGLHEARGCRW